MDDKELEALWEQLYNQSKDYFSEKICKQWIIKLKLLYVDEEKVILGAPNDFIRELVQDRYMGFLEDIVTDVLGRRHVSVETISKQ